MYGEQAPGPASPPLRAQPSPAICRGRGLFLDFINKKLFLRNHLKIPLTLWLLAAAYSLMDKTLVRPPSQSQLCPVTSGM